MHKFEKRHLNFDGVTFNKIYEKIYMLNRLQLYDNLLVNNTFWMAIIYQNAYFLPTAF